ncbi:putative polysaccharide biosynthesis protein [Alkalicoccobacillus murimartini]|uniref:O-antigen/teichoic acid export membrane protein n=1 Tax=Alkalicoccobacillus murimartini TaxID=171685 RepID=A0ABT9YIJ9_9BACI|nr:polysaccharide biosynthesis protein [Alkalicoccobacillus murimartini]MDQ0207685.1 O-antigen/teichoic acid export membrane protein [Alkalicoccobacillus murimartini]
MKNQFLKGTFYLTAATFISKILGFIYIMPFVLIVGDSGYALYKYAYGPYTLMLSVATLGLPLAVSKYVAKYNSLGDYQAGRDLLRNGLKIMVGMGILSFTILFLFAPHLASLVIKEGDVSGNSHEDVVYVIRLVSIALLIIPPMSMMRGFFQGNQQMGPSALSTVLEQIVRIFFILAGSFTILYLLNGTATQAVGISTMGAFAGGLASLCLLLWIFFKRKERFPQPQDTHLTHSKIKWVPMLKELTSYAIPFVLVGLAIPVYQNIDTFTINGLLTSVGYTLQEAEQVNAIIGLAQILVLVPVSLATAFSISLIPNITASFNRGDLEDVIKKIKQTFILLMFVLLPAVVGMTLLSEPIYTSIFGMNNNPELGGRILAWYAPMGILFSLFAVSAAVLQGINKQKHAIMGLGLGILVKLILNTLLITSLHELGPILATYAGYLVSVSYLFVVIYKNVHIPVSKLLKPLIPIGMMVVLMTIIVMIFEATTRFLFSNVMGEYPLSFLVTGVSVLAGALFYLLASGKTGLIRLIVRRNES